uniref:Uncharacterized protein n=1 Tax=Oryza brachyantha TaxID=4533 RepID=J3MUJ3_ORYBR
MEAHICSWADMSLACVSITDNAAKLPAPVWPFESIAAKSKDSASPGGPHLMDYQLHASWYPATLQYLAPYTGAALAEYFMWAHEPLANLIRWRDKPVALSIVQARLVGLAHFSVGYIFTYAAFLIASTSDKFG